VTHDSPNRPFAIAVCVCTFRRNEPLKVAVTGIDVALRKLEADSGRTGAIVVVDDNPNQEAKSIVEGLRTSTGRHIEYCIAGKQNISVARNTALNAGFAIADFVALLDDDGEPWEDWLIQSFAVRDATDSDIVTGPFTHKPPANCPRWILDSPFLSAVERYPDRSHPPHGSTANALLRSSWFDSHPVRFREDLGVIGGEDMLFFHDSEAQGATHRYALNAVVWEVLPPERATFKYLLYSWTWYGNTEAVTNLEMGSVTRSRLLLRGGRRSVNETIALIRRSTKLSKPGGRYWASQIGRAVGMYLGAAGIRLPHK
jgi:succinoglycan biosynthesis protein ExoM